ncbi:EAL domain-containing protein [Bacillus sp. FJAT-49736]|uniref:putative bifunctional diguanylate cyclase/phosphodiesterase n=1 Tax=Bacillus sp. FJAT-49736 TaxID=2833582 RepID=UPI001BC9FDB1|nr:EAL domain-containing protein [Bacillus sp. FJAT-49736]MBS4174895.1 EAL domain-containing protein [Bacillus sp. FJAT-49736]
MIKIRQKVIIFSFFVLASELFYEVESFLHPQQRWYFHLFQLMLTVGMIVFLFLLEKDIQKTSMELKNSNGKLKNIFDTLDVAIWFHDLRSDTLLITPGIEKLYGRSLDEFYRDHDLWKSVIFHEDMPQIEARAEILKLGEPITSLYRIIRPDGEVRWIQDRGIPKMDESGELAEFTSVLFDITNHRESEDRYRSLVELSPDLILVVSRNKIAYINETGCKMLGASNTYELIGRKISTLILPESLKNLFAGLKKSKDKELSTYRFEIQVMRLDGKAIDVEMSMMPILYEGRNAWHVVGRDITERKKVEKTIENLAYYDTLTGLPNRNMFRRYLNNVLQQSNCDTLAILFLDLDRFKMINDTRGHTAGDLLLKKATQFLLKAVQSEGIVSRQGGDEFIIILENATKDKASEIAKRILTEFSNPIHIEKEEFFITPSIGVSMYPEDGRDQETLIKHADSAMYLAKEIGKRKYQFYTSKLDGFASRKMQIENGLRKAIAQNELFLCYQPKVHLNTGRIVGVEALVRWEHPMLGMISPGEFIPIAEETGLIIPLGNWVLENALNQFMNWSRNKVLEMQLAVNVSVRQLQDDDFITKVQQLIESSGMDAKWLELEITESIMQDMEKSIAILNRLRRIGIKIAIDDFGKGYSSLSYLRQLPIDKIKVDKLFVDDITTQTNQGSIIKSIIDMGHSLNFDVIAEGIEEREQVVFLKNSGCDLGQGYYFCKPIPAVEMQVLLEQDYLYNVGD